MTHRGAMTASHEPASTAAETGPDPRDASVRLADWGFLANPDLPDRTGPGYLLVALRPETTLRHYDPESIEYWETQGHPADWAAGDVPLEASGIGGTRTLT